MVEVDIYLKTTIQMILTQFEKFMNEDETIKLKEGITVQAKKNLHSYITSIHLLRYCLINNLLLIIVCIMHRNNQKIINNRL